MEKQGTRASLIENIEAELEKDAGDIDPDFIDRRIDELYALDGLSPPRLGDGALAAAARTVSARAAWRRRNALEERAQKRRFARRAVHGVCAACFAALVLFSANHVTTLATGSCIPSKVGVNICCGTKYCLCDIAQAEGENPSHPE